MNWGILLLVVGAGLVAALIGLFWPYLNPESPFWAQQRLLELVRTWGEVRDLKAAVTVLRPGEPLLRVRLFYLAGAAVRLEVEEPPELAGEVYTLRPVAEGWLLVHLRPRLALGLEARFSDAEFKALFSSFAQAQGDVRWHEGNAFVWRGQIGPYHQAEVHVGGEFSLPQRIVLHEPEGTLTELQISWLGVNEGMELRELLILDPFPTRWIRIPVLLAPGA
ncbi:MAG: hypothetical protein ACK42E_03240 [Candidatus Bipolaricaulaceae bacterium]